MADIIRHQETSRQPRDRSPPERYTRSLRGYADELVEPSEST